MIIGSSGWLPGHCYVGTKTFERFLCVVFYVLRGDSRVLLDDFNVF